MRVLMDGHIVKGRKKNFIKANWFWIGTEKSYRNKWMQRNIKSVRVMFETLCTNWIAVRKSLKYIFKIFLIFLFGEFYEKKFRWPWLMLNAFWKLDIYICNQGV